MLVPVSVDDGVALVVALYVMVSGGVMVAVDTCEGLALRVLETVTSCVDVSIGVTVWVCTLLAVWVVEDVSV